MGAGASTSSASSSGRLPGDKQHTPVRSGKERSERRKRRQEQFGGSESIQSYKDGLDDLEMEQVGVEMVMSMETREIILKAITGFLMINGSNFRDNVIDAAIRSMRCMDYEAGTIVIQEGDAGSVVHIVENGMLEVTVNGRTIRTLGTGALFGELALLFDAKRSATVTCTSPCRLWSLGRNAFKSVQRNAANLAIITRTRRFLVVPELAALPSSSLARLMATLTPMSYKVSPLSIRFTRHHSHPRPSPCTLRSLNLVHTRWSNTVTNTVTDTDTNTLNQSINKHTLYTHCPLPSLVNHTP